MEELEAQPFLSASEKGEAEFLTSSQDPLKTRRPEKRNRLRTWTTKIATHGLVAAALLLALNCSSSIRDVVLLRSAPTRAGAHPTLYSPLTPAIQYKIDTPPEDYWHNDLYFGPPSEASERAWNKLVHPHGIQVFPDEAEHFDQLNTVKLENGNHLFILGVHHNLHCLRRLRQTLQADHYYPNMTDEFWEHDREHLFHCLEAIRTSMLCHPDLTTNRYFWSGKYWHDLNVKPDVQRECVDWDRLDAFRRAGGRAYDPRQAVHEGVTQGEYIKTHDSLPPSGG